jgi:hypothetical protein
MVGSLNFDMGKNIENMLMATQGIRALPRIPAKGPLKAYRGTIHKTKAPPTAL